jgi:hypothetical protein
VPDVVEPLFLLLSKALVDPTLEQQLIEEIAGAGHRR